VNNVNDPPVLTPVSKSVTEGGTALNDYLIAFDPDAGEHLTYHTTASELGFRLHADGRYTFDATDSAYDHLAAGQKQDIVIPITVTDSHGGVGHSTLTITLTGTDDVPKLSGSVQLPVTEDERVFSSHLTVIDPDSSNSVEFTTTAGVPGFTLHTDGSWSFDPGDAAYQSLAEGEPKTLVIPVTVTDTTGAGTTKADAITIQLMGTNDVPVVSHVITAPPADEDAVFTFAVPADTFADIDSGDTLTLSTGAMPAWLHF
ncbi:VCBS domain-containing protein, partial [Pseudomaricurvus sp. HS19]|uniref:VCBS domain-containing protein n=1 Tax=Pseudomaricurvus sp. HS19 TaxID=2692626 RepID=UPI00137213A7